MMKYAWIFTVAVICLACKNTDTQDAGVASAEKVPTEETVEVAASAQVGSIKNAKDVVPQLEEKADAVSKPVTPSKQNAENKVNVTKVERTKSQEQHKSMPSEKDVVVVDEVDIAPVSNSVSQPVKVTKPVKQVTEQVQEKVIQEEIPSKVIDKEVKEVKTVIEEQVKEVKNQKPSGRVAQSRPMHKFFDYILRNSVSPSGVVDYKAIQADEERLDNYLGELQRFPPKADWTKAEKLAYWINAYNAYTIKLIVDNYPLKSITDLEGGKPWDKKWIELDGKSLSLNDIENGIIRPTFKEPRIHFAVNCAAKSCPPLANAAYTKDNLETLLQKNTVAFINNPQYNDLSGKAAKVSKIFEWYAEDFGDVAAYINRYMQMKRQPFKQVEFLEYDWSLNGK